MPAGGEVKWVVGIKEGIWCDEHWVLYVSDELLISIPETNILLYINSVKFKFQKEKLDAKII